MKPFCPNAKEEEINGAPGRIRTSGLMIRSHSLYPTELRARKVQPFYFTGDVAYVTSEGGCYSDKSDAFFYIESAAKEEFGDFGFIEAGGVIFQMNGLISSAKIHFTDTVYLTQGTECAHAVFRGRRGVTVAEIH
jgi:hypothetical protein